MVELVDTQDLKSCSRKRSAGSIPALSTKSLILAYRGFFVFSEYLIGFYCSSRRAIFKQIRIYFVIAKQIHFLLPTNILLDPFSAIKHIVYNLFTKFTFLFTTQILRLKEIKVILLDQFCMSYTI